MIDLALRHAGDPGRDGELERELKAHEDAVRASVGGGDPTQVAEIEKLVHDDPGNAFEYAGDGTATLRAGRWTFPAGRFEVASIGALRRRCRPASEAGGVSRIRLSVLLGDSPATDVGSLQASAGPGTLFQVASQFNCLEAREPYVAPIASYFDDPTQGPRASIFAFPGIFLRHYAAPDREGGRFVQETGARQLNLLHAVCSPGIATVQNGYLTSSGIHDPAAFADALESRFEELCVGLHDDVPVVLGVKWDGAVVGSPRIGQVFTSTFAGGVYSPEVLDDAVHRRICTELLRAAYLGTLLGAAALQRPKVVLTLIGGGVFKNQIPLIWEAILWALEEAEGAGAQITDVIVNVRTRPSELSSEVILRSVRERGGVMLKFGAGQPSVQR